MPDLVRERVPNAFVRGDRQRRGYGAAANEVLRLVEGDNGFFCFLHDDVALDPGAIRLLVEELYRSNAGIVGPKLVVVGRPRRPAARRPRRRPLRRDRLVRRGGRGRPGAARRRARRVRPAVRLPDGPRRPVPGDRRLRHCDRLLRRRRRPVLAGAPRRRPGRGRPGGAGPPPRGARRAPSRPSPGTAAGAPPHALDRHADGRSTPAAAGGAAAVRDARPSSSSVCCRASRAKRGHRCARWSVSSHGCPASSFGAARFARCAVSRRRDRRSAAARLGSRLGVPAQPRHAPVAWRELDRAAVAADRRVGADVRLDLRARRAACSAAAICSAASRGSASSCDCRSARGRCWPTTGRGGGATASARPTPVPTGVALTALASTVTLFHMGLLHTVGVLGLLLVGYLGIWRLATLFPTARARIAALIVYAAVPLPSQLLSSGRWGALACYAAVPWVMHLLRRSAGIESFDSLRTTHRADGNRADAYVPSGTRPAADAVAAGVADRSHVRVRAVVRLRWSWRSASCWPSPRCLPAARGGPALIMLSIAVAAAALGFLANLPWASSLFGRDGWDLIAGVPAPVADGLPAGSVGEPRARRHPPRQVRAGQRTVRHPGHRAVPARSRRAARRPELAADLGHPVGRPGRRVRLARGARRPRPEGPPARARRAAGPRRRRAGAVGGVHRRRVPGRRAGGLVRLAPAARPAQRSCGRRSACCRA